MATHLTTVEVGKLLKVAHTTVQEWVDRGYLKAMRTPGGHRRITPEALRAFLLDFHHPIPEKLGGFSSKVPRLDRVWDGPASCTSEAGRQNENLSSITVLARRTKLTWP